jgi:protein ImuB
MVAAVLIPRFSLRAASPLDSGEEPAALAPAIGARAVLDEVSAAAEAQGVRPGMALGESLARCPSLRLRPADPDRAAELWEGLLGRLEGIGAAVESEQAGAAFFAIDGLLGLYGGEVAGVLTEARSAARLPVRVAAAPGRFAAALAAGRGKRLPRALHGDSGEAIVPEGALKSFLTPQPLAALRGHLDAPGAAQDELIDALGRLGVRTLGRLGRLGRDHLADRFGPLGLQALDLACGQDTPLRPRSPQEELAAAIELPEGTAGAQLERALELVVERLLAAPQRKGRTLLALRLSAPLAGGGSWSVEQGLGRPSASAQTIRRLLAPRLEALPGPAAALRLKATALGPAQSEQLELDLEEEGSRRRRLGAALGEVRAASGAEALLRILELDRRSRVPERRFALAPFPEEQRR